MAECGGFENHLSDLCDTEVRILYLPQLGELAEWLKATVWKAVTVMVQGFESLTLRNYVELQFNVVLTPIKVICCSI